MMTDILRFFGAVDARESATKKTLEEGERKMDRPKTHKLFDLFAKNQSKEFTADELKRELKKRRVEMSDNYLRDCLAQLYEYNLIDRSNSTPRKYIFSCSRFLGDYLKNL